MAIYTVITDQDIGAGLKTEGGKLKVDVDGTSIRLNGQNKLEAITQVDVKLEGAELDGNNLKLTLSDQSEITVDLAKFLNVDTNTKVVSGQVNGSTLTLTMSDGPAVSVDLSPFITASIKGNELQSLGGSSLGYLVK